METNKLELELELLKTKVASKFSHMKLYAIPTV